MKSMSMPSFGMLRLNCVAKWQYGFWSTDSPPIHILEGENVCIQTITPAQRLSAFAARITSVISSGVFATGFNTSEQGSLPDRFIPSVMICACSFT